MNQVFAHYLQERLPRYTSYPTAPQFRRSDTANPDYASWLAAVEPQASGSIYIHVPFCRQMCWYCGCHTKITRQQQPVLDYLGALRREIGLVARHMRAAPKIRSLHFGGGTPTILEPADFRALMGLLRDEFDIDPAAEIAIEIDPRTLTPDMVDTLGACGVNRASLGVQSFDATVQKAIARVQTVEQTAEAVKNLRAAGIARINLDLIYGLPHQTVASCADTVAHCVAMQPDRLAVFGYAHVPSFKKHQRKVDEAALPGAEGRVEQAAAIASALCDAGYESIGIDHFARPDDPLALAARAGTLHRNFQGYTCDDADFLIGLGASAIGRFRNGYVQNEVPIGAYAERLAHGALAASKTYAFTDDDRMRASIIEKLMCRFRVDLAQECQKYGRDFRGVLAEAPQLRRLADDGLIRLEGSTVVVRPEAHCLVRKVASAFDAFLAGAPKVFSPAV